MTPIASELIALGLGTLAGLLAGVGLAVILRRSRRPRHRDGRRRHTLLDDLEEDDPE